MIEINYEPTENLVKILVIGVGGAGNNAIDRMIDMDVEGVDFLAVNTDKQVLLKSHAPSTMQIGEKTAKGLGCGSIPDVGAKSAEESHDDIVNALQGVNMVFVTCGMGGGTGTGASPVIAGIAKEMGILTVGVVTKPFEFEGKLRMKNAIEGIEKLKDNVDSLIVIPNDKLLQVVDKRTSIQDAFRKADDVLVQAVSGITDLINIPALINLDFADVQTVMCDKGVAHIGIGTASGDDKALEAVKQAVSSPLLETTIDGATNIIINVSGDIGLYEAYEAADYVKERAAEDANIIFGAMEDESRQDQITVTVIATGLDDRHIAGPNLNSILKQDKNVIRSSFSAKQEEVKAAAQQQAQPRRQQPTFKPAPQLDIIGDDTPAPLPRTSGGVASSLPTALDLDEDEPRQEQQPAARRRAGRDVQKINIPDFLRTKN